MVEGKAEEMAFTAGKNMLQRTAVMLGTLQSQKVFFRSILGVLSAQNLIMKPSNVEVDCLVSTVVGDIVYLFARRMFQMPRNHNSSNHNRSNLTSEKLCVALALRCLMPMHQRGWGAQELGREWP